MTSEELRLILREDVLAGAYALLGSRIVTPLGSGIIVETEAYRFDDPGCHAFGRSKMANMALFGPPGSAYVYRCYGIHWMLNCAALPEGVAAGVLIRAAIPQGELLPGSFRGPGKLAKSLGIDAAINGRDLLDPEASFRLEPAPPLDDILAGPRIGLAVGKGERLPWRFVDARSLPYVSADRKDLSPYSLPLET